MFEDNLLENIKTETTMANNSHWLLKADVYFKCFESVLDAQIKLTLNTENNILSKEQDCCNNLCIQNEMHTVVEVYVPTVIL